MRFAIIVLCTSVLAFGAVRGADQPIQLHPDNPHYFLWRGQPTVLITSGEHYGAVLNADFDYVKYLDTLAQDHLNLTRMFTGGTYCEPPGAFKIARNTLAPLPGKFLCPFARSTEPGYRGGGNKFDLDRWDESYFERFRDFVAQASARGVVVEVNLFCPFYEESMWELSPLYPANNVNGVGQGLVRTNVYTLDQHGGTLPIQVRLARKLVEELRDCDNVYYELCNEPYFGGVTLAWQYHLANEIMEAQKDHPHQKLIARNVANGKQKVTDPRSAVSIYNFHYASPPVTVAMNYGLNKVIGDNETGFKGTNDAPYRIEAWEFIIAGGGLFNHLDYSFVAGHEDGSFVFPATQPGGGGLVFRRQLRILRDFINGFEFVKMQPDSSVIQGSVPKETWRGALADAGRAYAIYLRAGAENGVLEVALPAGEYRAASISPLSGQVMKTDDFKHAGGTKSLAAPEATGEIALKIMSR